MGSDQTFVVEQVKGDVPDSQLQGVSVQNVGRTELGWKHGLGQLELSCVDVAIVAFGQNLKSRQCVNGKDRIFNLSRTDKESRLT